MSGRNHPRFPGTPAEMLVAAAIGAAFLSPASAAGGPSANVPQTQTEVAPSSAKPEELAELLPLLLTSAERKKLATELEASVRQGDLKAAENRLNTAIELGTLAIILIDRLHDPNLLPNLQRLGIRADAQPSPSADQPGASPAPAVCTLNDASTSTNLLDLQEALEREKTQSSSASQKLAALTENHRILAARLESDAASAASKVSELQAALHLEQERSQNAAHELEKLQEEHRALQELQTRNADTATKVPELEAKLQQEQESSKDALRQLASAHEELRSLQAFKEKYAAAESLRITELKEALSREKLRGDAITRELANSIETIEELRAAQEHQEQGDTQAESAALPSDPPAPPPQPVSVATVASAPIGEQAPQKIASVAPLPGLGLSGPATPPAPAAPVEPVTVPDTNKSKAEAPPAPPTMEERLIARADELFRKGDVSGARLLLERSLESGNPRAAFLLAETYDPQVLSKIGALGIRGDVAKAREFYARAQALGSAQAGERMEALNKEPSR